MTTFVNRSATILRSRIVHNALSLYGIQGLNYLLPLLVLPYLLRVLGPHGYGTIVLAQSLMAYAMIVTDFGFNFTAARDISVARANDADVSRIYWTIVAARLFLFGISVVVLTLVVLCTPPFRHEWPTFLASGLMVLGNVVFPQWYLQGLERLKDAALIQACTRILATFATFLLVKGPSDVWIAAATAAVPQLLGIGVAAILRKPLLPPMFVLPRASAVSAALAGSWHMFASSIATTLYGNTNALVLGLMAGDRAVAMYSLAQRLVLTLQGLAMPITQAIFPRASLLFASDNLRARQLMKKVVLTIFPAVSIAAIVLAYFAPEIARLLGGEAFGDAGTLIRIMAITPVVIAAGALPAQIVIVSNGLTKQLLRIYVGVGLANLVLLPPLILAFAERGAAVSFSLAEIAATSLMVTLAWKGRKLSGVKAPEETA